MSSLHISSLIVIWSDAQLIIIGLEELRVWRVWSWGIWKLESGVGIKVWDWPMGRNQQKWSWIVSNIYKTTSGHLRPKNETSNSSVRGLLLRCCSMTKVTNSLRLLTLLRPVLLRHFGFTLWVQAFWRVCSRVVTLKPNKKLTCILKIDYPAENLGW